MLVQMTGRKLEKKGEQGVKTDKITSFTEEEWNTEKNKTETQKRRGIHNRCHNIQRNEICEAKTPAGNEYIVRAFSVFALSHDRSFGRRFHSGRRLSTARWEARTQAASDHPDVGAAEAVHGLLQRLPEALQEGKMEGRFLITWFLRLHKMFRWRRLF